MDMISSFSGVDLLSLDKMKKDNKPKAVVKFAEIEEESVGEREAPSDFSSECLSRSITPNSPSGNGNVESWNAS